MPQTTANGRIVLTFNLGFNSSKKTHREQQWKAYDGGVLFVPHYHSPMPTENGEQWACRRLDQIGPRGLNGNGVVVVWLVERYVSPTQERKLGRETHRQQFTTA